MKSLFSCPGTVDTIESRGNDTVTVQNDLWSKLSTQKPIIYLISSIPTVNHRLCHAHTTNSILWVGHNTLHWNDKANHLTG